MSDMRQLAGQIDWATKNLAYNLDFIPDDKLNWKPAPTALSALEIVGHLLGVIQFFQSSIDNPAQTAAPTGDGAAPASRDEAKTKLVAAGEEYAHWLASLSPEKLAEQVELPFGTFPVGFVVSMVVTDAVHHHGQIAYIQSLLGDSEPHFDFSLLPRP